jgi:hypothetical protein
MPLRKGNELAPLMGLSINKTAKVPLKGLVDNLSLTITLRVIGRGHAQLGAVDFEELLPKLTHEDGIPIRYHGF